MVAFNGVTGHRHGRETIEQEMAGVRARARALRAWIQR